MLTTKNLTLTIAKKTLCRDLTLEIQPGEIWGILGPNGCGKSTLLHTLAGLLAANGEIILHGKKLADLSRKTIARHIGILFQQCHDLFPQTVYEFCRSGRYPYLNYFGWENEKDTDIVHQALETMELTELKHKNIQHLSGGERRRLSIATLIAQTPTLYLLDEPTNHLDLRHQVKTLTYFRSIANSQSISAFISLHDINLAAQFCDRILMLTGDGRFILGQTKNMLTEENLSFLYQQPLTKRMGFYPY